MEDKDPCNSRTYTEGLDCCVNFFLQNRSCLPCLPGSFGPNCSQNCPVGFFGNLCGGICDTCSVEDCRPDYGCPNTSTVTEIEIEATSISSTLSSSLSSKSVEKFVSTPVKVLSTEFTTKFTQLPNVVVTVLTEQTSNPSVTLIVSGAIIFLLLVILLAVLRKLWVMHMQRNYRKNEIESKHFTDGNEEDEYQEIDIDGTMVNHGDVLGNRYNIIMEELAQHPDSKYKYNRAKLDKEGKSVYSHYHEIDNENSTSSGNNGGYIEPESRRPTHSYIEVIEPMIHASDPVNSDQDGGSSDKSDQLEEYQDTMNIDKSNKPCLNDVNESKPHDSSMSDTYLDVVHDLS